MRYRAALDRLQRLQPGDDPIQRHAQCMGGSGGSQGIGDIVPPQQVELDLRFTRYALQPEAHAAARIALQIGGAEIGLGPVEGESQQRTAAGTGLPGVEGLVVQVQHGGAVGGQPFEYLALRLDDLLRSAELADMGGAGIGDDRHVRAGQLDRVGDLADARGAQFDHCATVLRRQLQQGQRYAEVVVQIATGSQHRLGIAGLGTQDAGEHLLDRGLAAGARHGRQRAGELAPVQRAQSPQGRTGIAHQQLRQGRVGDFALHQRSHRALGGNLGEIVVAVETRPTQGNEQLAGPDGATVGGNRRKDGVLADQAGVQRDRQLAEAKRLKHAAPPRRPGRARPARCRRTDGVRRRSPDNPRDPCQPGAPRHPPQRKRSDGRSPHRATAGR